jgi:hypothetical protein
MVLPWLGPGVVAAPFAARAVAWTAALVLHQLAVMMVLWGLLKLMERRKMIRKSAPEPKLNTWYMMAINIEVRRPAWLRSAECSVAVPSQLSSCVWACCGHH